MAAMLRGNAAKFNRQSATTSAELSARPVARAAGGDKIDAMRIQTAQGMDGA
jgi:hypothetical protein